MSVIRPRLPADPLQYEAVGPDGRPWEPGDFAGRLDDIRRALIAEPKMLDLPGQLLADYGSRRPASRLLAILSEARRIRDAVDRVVIVAGGRISESTRLLVRSCCHPFHSHLPRGSRGGKPRLTWLDANSDNDRAHGLLDLVAPEGGPRSRDLLDQWAILAIGSHVDGQAVVATTNLLTAALEKTGACDAGGIAARFVAVAAPQSTLACFAASLGSDQRFHDEAQVDSPTAVFTAAVLLPAAIAGIDIVRLLEGAAAMLTRFTEAPVAINPVLIDAAFRDHAAREAHLEGHVFAGGGPALAGLSAWGRSIRPVPPESASLVTYVTIAESRRPRLGPEHAAASAGQPVTIRLPRLDEHALGQLLQFMILSAAVEQRLRESV